MFSFNFICAPLYPTATKTQASEPLTKTSCNFYGQLQLIMKIQHLEQYDTDSDIDRCEIK